MIGLGQDLRENSGALAAGKDKVLPFRIQEETERSPACACDLFGASELSSKTSKNTPNKKARTPRHSLRQMCHYTSEFGIEMVVVGEGQDVWEAGFDAFLEAQIEKNNMTDYEDPVTEVTENLYLIAGAGNSRLPQRWKQG